ncbi:MAG: cbb3-type cytochrome oxidase assembly protein CcoS, partial [Rhodospirillales bacterium]|nr:cbb3-type cytochrome oxidase assembly protein CcoS [Rhodospirillales bacterium]
PVSLLVGLVALGTFLWAMRDGQFDDLDGAANRILFDEDDDNGDAPEPPEER